MKMPLRKLVLLPGVDGSGELFREFLAVLPKDLLTEVLWYPPDRRTDYEELAGALRGAICVTEPFVLVAESYGAALAISIAAMEPPNLKGMVLCAGFATSPVRGWKKELAWRLSPLLSRVAVPVRLVQYLMVGDEAPRGLVESVTGAMSWVTPKTLSARLREVLTVDVRAELARVKVPILYVQPTRDRLVDGVCTQEMHLAKAGRTVSVDAPHLLLQTKPVLCAEVVTTFVRELM